ncbi:MAG: metallophosphoesterase, partial [Chlamydiia bacterium]|nr:metallophosphoesterase [Chlamydiia bacterium]
ECLFWCSSFMNTRLIRDCLCAVSVFGIWPRFIEPKWVRLSRQDFFLPQCPSELEGTPFVQLSDLHFHPAVSESFLERTLTKIASVQPKWIFLTGDTLCFGQFPEDDRLKNFLAALTRLGKVFAILGNHDYTKRIGINERGEYAIAKIPNSALSTAFRTLWHPVQPIGKTTQEVAALSPHPQLSALFEELGISLLNNTSVFLPEGINLVGLGEHMAGRCDPKTAFSTYVADRPGIILLHNPDGIPSLAHYPGEVILSGHTHGGQINLPGLWRRFTRIEMPQYKRGCYRGDRRWIYVNRGIGSAIPFRLFSPPEILVGTLR